ncbi:(2Fe-2S)-binding protein [Dickeya oryzae]|uniref:(2Fe-2S)-binding protein n=1 Tax=Dickeya oryzae TaxID=1240404 RepID=A0AB39IVD3_9GAMM|nr:2Fe-2S iron-sulfur cluster-binding protein [Dickeya oryzae]MBP2858793.1 (2Fe-2S)-binding protein [Dickeya oryzae]MCA6992140.1 (2Fe-2S)-binding protein [Dickeya oryzae]
MNPGVLSIKGVIKLSGGHPEVIKISVRADTLHEYDDECSGFNVVFDGGENNFLKLVLKNLEGESYLEDVLYPEELWCESGLLMALSVVFYVTGLTKIKVVEREIFALIGKLEKSNRTFPEINISELENKSNKVYEISYSYEEIVVSHNTDVFSLSVEQSILDAALSRNIELKHMCRSGICMKCRKKVLSGACMTLSQQEEQDMLKVQHLLTCNYKAITSLIIG